jgi:hypothetical protein
LSNLCVFIVFCYCSILRVFSRFVLFVLKSSLKRVEKHALFLGKIALITGNQFLRAFRWSFFSYGFLFPVFSTKIVWLPQIRPLCFFFICNYKIRCFTAFSMKLAHYFRIYEMNERVILRKKRCLPKVLIFTYLTQILNLRKVRSENIRPYVVDEKILTFHIFEHGVDG